VPTFRDHTEPYLSTYTPVLPAGPGVCQVCHGAPGQGFDRCSSCVQTMRQVSFPVRRVVPISLYQTPGQLWKVLRDYKDGLTVTQRHKFTLQVAATIGRFLVGHQRCITGPIQEPWDLIVTVPSSKERTGAHPLRRAIGMLPPPFSDHEADVLHRGPSQIDHRHADDHGFLVGADVRGAGILLVDDTLTTGARAQSAASALRLAGGRVVAAVVVGRVIRPEWSKESAALWKAARGRRFSFDTCCLELDVPPEPPFDLDAS
jgi:predicted amidophosphoribosyltransferase